MIEGTSQIRDIGGGVVAIIPDTDEGQAAVRELKLNRVVRHKITTIGALKRRSVAQLNLYFAICKLVSDNSDDPNFATKDLVSEFVKVKLRFIDSWMAIDGAVHIKTKSISFAELRHMAACGFFDRAFDLLAKELGITVEKLIAEAKARMWSY